MLNRYQFRISFVLGLILLTAVGCGTRTTLRGSIVGTIVDSQTGIGVAGASDLTSPSTATARQC